MEFGMAIIRSQDMVFLQVLIFGSRCGKRWNGATDGSGLSGITCRGGSLSIGLAGLGASMKKGTPHLVWE